MIVKKVNIDELVDLLLTMRRDTQYIDLSVEADNVLKVRRHMVGKSPEVKEGEDTPPDISKDLNQLLG